MKTRVRITRILIKAKKDFNSRYSGATREQHGNFNRYSTDIFESVELVLNSEGRWAKYSF